jgi:hypothetical protein
VTDGEVIGMTFLARIALGLTFGVMLVSTLACQNVAAPRPTSGLRVLFVGNSLTEANDLPGTVESIARSAGVSVAVSSATGGGLALIDHLNGATNAEQQIKRGGWTTIVLQQGPTTTGLCRDSLVLWSQMFARLADGVHADVALFMTWPALGVSPGGFDEVRLSYQQAAYATQGIFLPAGEAWRSAMRLDASIAPFGPDNFHPSPIGTYLAALTIFERLAGVDVRTLAPTAFVGPLPLPLPEATVRLLQNAAHDANTRYPARLTAPVVAPSPPGTTLPGGHC